MEAGRSSVYPLQKLRLIGLAELAGTSSGNRDRVARNTEVGRHSLREGSSGVDFARKGRVFDNFIGS